MVIVMQKVLATHLNQFRVEQGVTQEVLAEKVGVTRQTIISIEKGSYSPSVALALRLANTLKVSVEDLFYLK
jgi:putative transcriptional regulator